MLGIPDLGYLFDIHDWVSPFLSSLAHPEPQAPHLSAPAKPRQTCLVFAQVFYINQWTGRAMQWREHLLSKHAFESPKSLSETVAITAFASVMRPLSWTKSESSENSRPEQKLTEFPNYRDPNGLKQSLQWLITSVWKNPTCTGQQCLEMIHMASYLSALLAADFYQISKFHSNGQKENKNP